MFGTQHLIIVPKLKQKEWPNFGHSLMVFPGYGSACGFGILIPR